MEDKFPMPRVLSIATAVSIGFLSLTANAVPVTKEYRFVVGPYSDYYTGRPVNPVRPVSRGYFRFTFDPDGPEFDPDGPGGQFVTPDAVDFSIAGRVFRPNHVEVSIRKFFAPITDLPYFRIVVGGIESSSLAMAPGTNDFQLYATIDTDGRDSLTDFFYFVRFSPTLYYSRPQFADTVAAAEPSSLWLLIFGIGAAVASLRRPFSCNGNT